jgi:release factor glutamine methyltransferase
VTFAEALAEGRAALQKSGADSPALDARLLLADASGLDAAALIARRGDTLPSLAYRTFKDHLTRRERGEPVARIFGAAEFFGLRLKLGPATLVPRPETETLVELVLAEARSGFKPNVSICDLGTGSGAIAIALLSELPQAHAVATDIAEASLSVAMLNAEQQGMRSRITFLKAAFADPLAGPFDIVVSNPPYIRSGVIPALAREVREYDPRVALDGGPDGLAAYRSILAQAPELVSDRGILALEIGYDQGESVAALCRGAGLGEVVIHRDLAGHERVVMARKSVSRTNWQGSKKPLGKVRRFGLASARKPE